MTTSERTPAAGFTLLEMLVVLLIAGFALLLTTQAISQYQRAHARLSIHERAGREYRLGETWFRDSARALVAIVDDPLAAIPPAPAFEGRSDGFTGITLAPVLAGQGIPTVQTWQVVTGAAGRDVLELEESGRRLVIPLFGGGRARLHYLDEEGLLHDQWPPQALGEEAPQLPAAVALELEADADGRGGTIVAAITGPRWPLELPYEPEPF